MESISDGTILVPLKVRGKRFCYYKLAIKVVLVLIVLVSCLDYYKRLTTGIIIFVYCEMEVLVYQNYLCISVYVFKYYYTIFQSYSVCLLFAKRVR